MGIKSIKVDETGLVGVIPRLIYLETNDNAETILGVGYLNRIVADGTSLDDKSMALISYKDSPNDRENKVGFLRVVKSGTDWSLEPQEEASSGDYPILVGTGYQYETAKQAIDAGVTEFIIITDVTETEDIVLTDNVTIRLGHDIIWGLGTNSIDVNSVANRKISILGDSNTYMTYGNGSGVTLVKNCDSSTEILLKDFTFINSSTADNAQVSDEGILKINNMVMEIPDFASCGMTLRYTDCYIDNLVIVGGGVACTNAILGQNGSISNLSVYGTWSLTTQIIEISANCVATNVLRETGNTSNWHVTVAGSLLNCNGEDGLFIDMRAGGIITNIFGIDTLDVDAFDNVRISNCETRLFTQETASEQLVVNGLVIKADSSFLGSKMTINGLRASQDVVITLQSVDSTWTGCVLGTTNGGLGTFNLVPSAEGNTFDGCLIEATAFTDTSGGTQNRYATATSNVCNAQIGGDVI